MLIWLSTTPSPIFNIANPVVVDPYECPMLVKCKDPPCSLRHVRTPVRNPANRSAPSCAFSVLATLGSKVFVTSVGAS